MLWRRSASLISTTPMSSTIARNILRRLSACARPSPAICVRRRLRAVQGIRPSLVTPSTRRATRWPNCFSDLLDGDAGIFDDIVQEGGGDGFGVELHPGENHRDFNRMDDIWFARLPAVRAVRRDSKFSRAPDEVDICIRGALADDVKQCIERGADFGSASAGICRRRGGMGEGRDRSVRTVRRGNGYCPRWHANLCICVTEKAKQFSASVRTQGNGVNGRTLSDGEGTMGRSASGLERKLQASVERQRDRFQIRMVADEGLIV